MLAPSLKSLTLGVCVMLGLALNVSAAAQVSQSPSEPAPGARRASELDRSTSQSKDDLLAGPQVEEDADESTQSDMMAGPQRQRRAQQMPLLQWMSALRGLSLSNEQQEAVRAISAEFQQAQREFQDALSDEDRQMLREARHARQSGEALVPEVRKRIGQIEAERPKPGPYQQRIWELLTQEQREQMKAKLEQIRKAGAARRADGREAGENGAPEVRRKRGRAKGADSMDKIYEGRRRRGGDK